MTAAALAATPDVAAAQPPVSPMTASSDRKWAPTAERQPLLASTARRYLQQISVSLSTSSVDVADKALRLFCLFLAEQHPQVSGFPRRGSFRTTNTAVGSASAGRSCSRYLAKLRKNRAEIGISR